MKPDFFDETQTVALIRSLAVIAGELHVTSGNEAGTTVRIDSPSFTIGSGSTATLRLTDKGISREHVRIATLPTGILIQDAGSKNGTWIGTMRIDRVTVSSSVTLKVGDATLEVRIDAKPSALTISEDTRFGDALGFSPAIRAVFAYLLRAASSDVSILLEGENGVGKEVLANAVHRASSRAKGPFVTVDCAAIPSNLFESELFGYERGAFTGADRDKMGLFEEANGGTLFLDELGELPIDVQPKLLRALEQREVRSVGGTTSRPLDIRVIAATNRNLKEQIASRAFREDLYYRLAVAQVRIPALRERSEDIVPLATQFLREISNEPGRDLPRDVGLMFATHTWPGNVRELKNAVRRFVYLGATDEGALFEGGLALTPGSHEDLSHLSYGEARQLVVERMEEVYFPAILRRSEGNVSRAAGLAKLARSSFYRIMDRLGTDVGETSE